MVEAGETFCQTNSIKFGQIFGEKVDEKITATAKKLNMVVIIHSSASLIS